MEIKIKSLKEENKKLRDENRELKLKHIDESKYKEWDYKQIIFWILSLDNGLFKQYENTLSTKLKEADLEGSDLNEVNE